MNARPSPTRRATSLSLLCAAALATGCSTAALEDASCPPEGTSLTYEDFGQAFIGTWCQPCHASQVIDRQGAPPAYVFDTHEQVQRWADRIYARSAGVNDSMPPGPDDPSDAERDDLEEWLACGAP